MGLPPRILMLALSLCLACSESEGERRGQAGTRAGAGRIERIDAAFDSLIAADARIEKLADGFRFTEGPLWIDDAAGGYLLFSDIPNNTIHRFSDSEGTRVFLEPVTPPGSEAGGTGGSNGLTADSQGRVVLFEHGNRQVSRLEPDGTRSILADRYQGARLNSPNDGVYHSSGALYFTDPPFGLPAEDRHARRELAWSGVYRLSPQGELELVDDSLEGPNGIGFSPDERTLYVANYGKASERKWMAYPVKDDGSVGRGQVFFDASALRDRGAPDGLAIDTRGNVWATGPGGVLVISPEGRHLGTLRLPRLPANVAFGEDGHSLFIAARSAIYRLRTKVRGR